jgi:hypothetical protein
MPQLNQALVNRIVEKNEATLSSIEGINYQYIQELNKSKEARQQLHKAIRIICKQIDSLEIRNLPIITLTAIQQIIIKNSPCRLKSLIIFDKIGHAYQDRSYEVEPYLWYASKDVVSAESYTSPAASPPTLSPIPSITRVETPSSTSSSSSPPTSPLSEVTYPLRRSSSLSPISPMSSTDADVVFASPEPSPVHTNMSFRNAFILKDLQYELAICENEMNQARYNYEDRKATYNTLKDTLHKKLAQIKLNRLIPPRFYKTKMPLSVAQTQVTVAPISSQSASTESLYPFLLPEAPNLGEREVSAPKIPLQIIDKNEFGALDKSIVPAPQASKSAKSDETNEETEYVLTPLKIADRNTDQTVAYYKGEYEALHKMREDNLQIRGSIMLAAQQIMELKTRLVEEKKKEIENFKNRETKTIIQTPRFFPVVAEPILRPANSPCISKLVPDLKL